MQNIINIEWLLGGE